MRLVRVTSQEIYVHLRLPCACRSGYRFLACHRAKPRAQRHFPRLASTESRRGSAMTSRLAAFLFLKARQEDQSHFASLPARALSVPPGKMTRSLVYSWHRQKELREEGEAGSRQEPRAGARAAAKPQVRAEEGAGTPRTAATARARTLVGQEAHCASAHHPPSPNAAQLPRVRMVYSVVIFTAR